MKTRVLSRVLLLVLIMSMVLALVSCSKVKDSSEERVLRMDIAGNTGFPAMYTTASNGPGYAIMSYMFDTLVWKDGQGELNLLADCYSVSDDQRCRIQQYCLRWILFYS